MRHGSGPPTTPHTSTHHPPRQSGDWESCPWLYTYAAVRRHREKKVEAWDFPDLLISLFISQTPICVNIAFDCTLHRLLQLNLSRNTTYLPTYLPTPTLRASTRPDRYRLAHHRAEQNGELDYKREATYFSQSLYQKIFPPFSGFQIGIKPPESSPPPQPPVTQRHNGLHFGALPLPRSSCSKQPRLGPPTLDT